MSNSNDWFKNIDHYNKDQLTRQKSATHGKLTPVLIDKENQFAFFQGSGKSDYKTTLVGCDCMDFRRRQIPCKHMYRLAHEFEVFDLISPNTKQSKTHTVHTIQTLMRKDEIIEAVNCFAGKLPEDEARTLKHVFYEIIYRGSIDRNFNSYNNECVLATSLSLGLVSLEPYTPEFAITHITVPVLKKLLQDNCIEFNKKAKRAELVELALTVIPDEILEFMPLENLGYKSYNLNPKYEAVWNALYRRFTKLYPEVETFYNPDTGDFEPIDESNSGDLTLTIKFSEYKDEPD